MFLSLLSPRILILQYLMSAAVPGWSMGSLQNAIWSHRHQHSSIRLQWRDNCPPLYSDTSDTYRCSWNKTGSTREGGGGSVVIILTSDLFSVWSGRSDWLKHRKEMVVLPARHRIRQKNDLNSNLRWVLQNVLICHLITNWVTQVSNLSMAHASKLQHPTSCPLLRTGRNHPESVLVCQPVRLVTIF